MKNYLLIFTLACQSLQAMDNLLPGLKHRAILQQREAAQTRWYSFKKPRPSDTLLGLYGRHANLPAELKETLLREQLAAEFTAHMQTPRNSVYVDGLLVRACAFTPDSTKLAIIPLKLTSFINILYTTAKRADIHFYNIHPIDSIAFDRASTMIGFRDNEGMGVIPINAHGPAWSDRVAWSKALLFSRATPEQRIEDLVYLAADRTTLIRANAFTGEELARVHTTHGPIKALAALTNSAGTETIITSHEDTLVLGDKKIRLPAAPADSKHQLAVSPCQRYCALRRGSQVNVYDTVTERFCPEYGFREAVVSDVVFDPSGSSYRYMRDDGTLVQRSSQTGTIMLTHRLNNVHNKRVACAAISPNASQAFICYDKSFSYLEDITARRTLIHYFSKPRPHDQALLVKLLFMYHSFINNDPTVRKNRMHDDPLFVRLLDKIAGDRLLPTLNAILINQFVEFLQGTTPNITLKDLEKTRNTMPLEVQRALAKYLGLYVRKATTP